MSNELMLALSGEVEHNERYRQAPPVLTKAGQMDRRHEAEHVVAIRDEERRARELVVAAATEAVGDIAWIEARARVNTEAKFALSRAKKESRVIADDDPELVAEFGILDAEFFQQTRGRSNRPQPINGLFG
jgi:hypothetical protein